LSSNIYKIQQS